MQRKFFRCVFCSYCWYFFESKMFLCYYKPLAIHNTTYSYIVGMEFKIIYFILFFQWSGNLSSFCLFSIWILLCLFLHFWNEILHLGDNLFFLRTGTHFLQNILHVVRIPFWFAQKIFSKFVLSSNKKTRYIFLMPRRRYYTWVNAEIIFISKKSFLKPKKLSKFEVKWS